eukprot:54028-Pyramimonas_sp.AAC.2
MARRGRGEKEEEGQEEEEEGGEERVGRRRALQTLLESSVRDMSVALGPSRPSLSVGLRLFDDGGAPRAPSEPELRRLEFRRQVRNANVPPHLVLRRSPHGLSKTWCK